MGKEVGNGGDVAKEVLREKGVENAVREERRL